MKLSMAEFLEQAKDGRIFTVGFVKRGDGSERWMTARTGVTKGTKGGSVGYDPAAKHLLSVYDVQARGFRMVNLEEPLGLRAKGRRYVWDRRSNRFVEVRK